MLGFTGRYLPLIALMLWESTSEARQRQAIAFDAAELTPRDAEFSLVVAGASTLAPYMVAGHLILRAKTDKADYSFDWGIFDPTKKDFFVDYVFGRLDYEHVVRPFHETISIYRREKRSLIEYPLQLTENQKAHLIFQLTEWAIPENRVYRYDIVFNNCSTVIGNLIGEIGGPSAIKSMDLPAESTVRQSGLPYLAHFPPIQIFSNIIGGQKSDLPVSKRHLFYLPVLVPKILTEVAPGLLGPPRQLIQGDNIAPSPASWTGRLSLALALVHGTFAFLAIRFNIRKKLFGVIIAPFLLAASLMGGIIIFLSFFSEHSFAWNNLQLLFFWPIDFVFLFLLARRPLVQVAFALTHLVMALVAVIWSYLIFDIPQDLSAGIQLTLPFWIAIVAVLALSPRAKKG